MSQAETEQPYPIMSAYAGNQNSEFLRYLLDTTDPLQDIELKLEGKQWVADGEKPSLIQVRPPLVNPVLHNQIMNILSTYNVKHFVVTKLDEKHIKRIVCDVANSAIDLIELSRTYSSIDWKKSKTYTDQYPAHMEGSHQEILLIIEHTVLASLMRSIGGTTLDKVTGMTSYIEQKTNNQEKGGILNNVFRR